MTMTYQEARAMMERARNGRRKLENNTYLETRYPDRTYDRDLTLHVETVEYAVRLHDTDVVTLHPDGSYTLDSGGWRTVTTKDRINRYAPVRLYSDKRVWWLRPRWVAPDSPHSDASNSVSVRFEDGMSVNVDGVPVAGTENGNVREVSYATR
jgi:hypothetical protein